jgi:toxin ParE1/3/4
VRVRWLRVALANLLEAAEYLESENPTAATASLERIVKAVYRLEHYPGIGRAGRIEGTRELVVASTPYVIPYRVRGQYVEILRVFHSARKWPAKLWLQSANSIA